VDDYPYGGGQGMVMQAEPVARCFEAICRQTTTRPLFIYMSPLGKVFDQQTAVELSQIENICLLCGHYEGVDERVLDTLVDRQISIGDFVLTGGELPALAVTDAVSRMIPGVLSEKVSFEDESHFSGLLEYPQYTKPYDFRGMTVPDVLLSGNHGEIAKWREGHSGKVE